MTTPKPDHKSTENLILKYILLFVVCAFIGWLWEVILFFARSGEFINRGVLHGPWLPIYGFGGLGIAVFLQKFKDHPIIVFFAALIGCGLMEYFTGWYLETFKGLKWWDYSNVPFNLDGRICLVSVVCFGVCGLVVTYVLYPVLIRLFNHIPFHLKKSLCTILLLCFIGDFIYSSDVPNVGRGITDQLF